MGGGKGGSFGNTKGSALDAISNILAVASFIPGVDTFTNLASIPVDLLRGDFVSAGLDAIGVIPFIGEIADGAKTVDKISDTVKAIDKVADTSKTVRKSKKINSSVLNSKRIGSATKADKHHSINEIIDNDATKGKTFNIKGGDGKTRKLYQVEGNLNGKNGVFEWIYEKNKGVTHRRYIENGKITGKPNFK